MARDTSNRPDQPTEPLQRRPTDALWFMALIVSVVIGLGMTIFAPVGDDPPPVASTTLPFAPTTTETESSTTQPTPSTATAPAT